MAWNSKLAGVVETKTGDRLSTLRDAAEFLQTRFAGVTKDAALVGTVEDLMAAAESGKKADRDQATDQLRTLLSAHHMLAGEQSGEDVQTRLGRQIARAKRTRR